MKKLFIMMVVGLILAGCGNADSEHNSGSAVKQTEAKSDVADREFIIRDSVDEPLPPEAQEIEAMPEKFEPQQIPNANLNDPIVITKMPYGDEEKP
ncbi:hypothetical protein [Lentibacillus sp. CBA3610]|uniref:hypothetical protein n=1 Tax=Lentibacillus sp. CBA3610 TaxID=2518176 RepID=UPI00159638DD|nr:hypothetical protein [Lentibacillus sp. CBA3610]QKY68351.1 hypothetical protein Len3610_00800 [Lentibacillus sp. CBA3610]